MKTRLIRGAVLFACFSAGFVLAAERNIDKEFTLNPGGELVMNVSGANVTIEAIGGDTVQLEARIRGSQKFLDNYEVTFDSTANRLQVNSQKTSRKWGWSWGSSSVSFKLKVPSELISNIRTSGGDIKVNGLRGEHQFKTSGGDVDIRDLSGPLNVRTSGGSIDVANTDGTKTLKTSGGDIRLSDSEGDLSASTSGGNVRLIGIAGAINASTSGGNITIDHYGQNYGLSAKTSGGSIRVTVDKGFAGELEARTSGGSVDLGDMEITIRGKVDRNRVYGKIGGGGELIQLRSSGGSIRLEER